MARKTNFDTRFEQAMKAYGERYDIESLTNPNDLANLHMMIRNQLVIEEMQTELHELASKGAVANAMDIKKINDSIVALAQINMQLEKTLGIDRRTRKQEQAESITDYIARIKLLAREFLDDTDRLQKVFCKSCNVMVGRISGVYDTTYYTASFQCPQCKKQAVITRKERDVFFDVKDADWRRKYPIEIVQAKRIKGSPNLPVTDNELIIGGELSEEEE